MNMKSRIRDGCDRAVGSEMVTITRSPRAGQYENDRLVKDLTIIWAFFMSKLISL